MARTPRLWTSTRDSLRLGAPLLVGFALALGACQAEPEGRPAAWSPSGEQAGDITIADNVYVVDSDQVYAGSEELVFYGQSGDDSLARSPGDVLVSGRVTSDSTGFLRKVEAVEQSGGDVVIETSEATLNDVFIKGGFAREFQPFSDANAMMVGPSGMQDILAPGADPAQTVNGGPEFNGGYLRLGNTKLVTDGGLDIELTSGHIDFDPSLYLDASFDWATIERFHIEASGSFDAEMNLRIRSDGYHKLSNKLAKLWESPKAVWTGAIGPVPVVVVTQLELGVDTSATIDGPLEIEVGAGASSWLEVGGLYDNGSWTKINDHQFTYSFTGPTFVVDAEASIKVLLDAKLKVAFYDLAGPWISIKPGVKAGLEGPDQSRNWFAEVGVESKFGGAIRLPGKNELGFEGTLFGWWYRFAEGTLGGGNNGGGNNGGGNNGGGDPGQSICGSQAPVVQAEVCNGGAIDLNVDAVTSCIQYGGGASCLTNPDFYAAPLCGPNSGGGYVCDTNALFSCLCFDGGTACVAQHCDVL